MTDSSRGCSHPALRWAPCCTPSFVLWLVTLQRYPVTTVYPVFVGAGFVGVALGGWLVLGEPFGAGRAVGALVVLAGIVLLAR